MGGQTSDGLELLYHIIQYFLKPPKMSERKPGKHESETVQSTWKTWNETDRLIEGHARCDMGNVIQQERVCAIAC